MSDDAGRAPAASIVIPSYRGVDRVPALLDCLAAQREGTPPFEAIVVVDGVDDGTVALVTREDRFPVRLILFPENRGRVAALNAGFSEARGEILIRCDDDLLPSRDYVRRHVEAHDLGKVAVVGLYQNVYEETRYAEVYGRQADRSFREDAYSGALETRWRYWAGNCSMPRAAFEDVGKYDPAYRLYGWEDVDYGFRLKEAGYEVVLSKELETPHRVAAVTARIRAMRAFHSAVARRIFDSKHPAHGLPQAAPSLSLWNAAVRAAASVIGARPDRAGFVVDTVIRVLPRSVARKIVALLVEGSALAGHRRPDSATEVF